MSDGKWITAYSGEGAYGYDRGVHVSASGATIRLTGFVWRQNQGQEETRDIRVPANRRAEVLRLARDPDGTWNDATPNWMALDDPYMSGVLPIQP